jgi:hypothetical protein
MKFGSIWGVFGSKEEEPSEIFTAPITGHHRPTKPLFMPALVNLPMVKLVEQNYKDSGAKI